MEDLIPTDLIIRYLSNEATTEEAEKLLNWVAQDSTHQKIFTEWMETWEHPISYPSSFNLSRGLKNLNERVDGYESEMKIQPPSFSWTKIAATVTLAVFASSSMFIAVRYSRNFNRVQYTEYKTPPGELATLALPDGSRITLNENTSLKYPAEFIGDKREVSIDGEAFFEIKKDSIRPFLVRTGELTTRVLGTSFNIQTRPGKVTVTVASGKVKVSQGADVVFLLPKEKITYSKNQRIMLKENADMVAALAWKNPPLIFQDARLSDVATSLEKHYGITMLFERESLKNCLLTGKFKNQSLEKVLSAISFSMGVQFRQMGNQFVLYGNGCEE